VLRVTAGAGGLFGEVRSGGLNHRLGSNPLPATCSVADRLPKNIRLTLWSAPTCRSFGFFSDSQFSSDIHSIRFLATRRSRLPWSDIELSVSLILEGGANDTAPAHATGVIRPSETAFVLALAISLAAYPTGEIQSSDKSEHSIEASLGAGFVFGVASDGRSGRFVWGSA
jgi:hypothetical protein